jgi:hypothetical protein
MEPDQTIEWLGIKLQVPAAWEIVRHAVSFANGRLVFDFGGQTLKLHWLGLGASYIWGHNFSGWSAGIDLRFQF